VDKIKSIFLSKDFRTFAVMALVSGLAYLPFVGQFGYFNDDWYLMYAAGAKGASVFREIFSIDRPLRAFVMMPAYNLFGANPLLYNLSALFFRLLSAFGVVCLSKILWPRYRDAGVFVGVLFLIYPGFLSQHNGIDYQSQMVGLAAAVFSLVFTLMVVRKQNKLAKTCLYVCSGLLAILYIGLVEYFIGFELVRLACIFLLSVREKKLFIHRIGYSMLLWIPFFLILTPFMVWRLFFFESQRSATDIGHQLNQVIQSPFVIGLRWLSTLLGDTLDVIILAWVQPLFSLLSWVRSPSSLLFGTFLGVIAVAIICFFSGHQGKENDLEKRSWSKEILWLGLFSVLTGLLPIIIVNRYVDFQFFSRYTLASSLGAVMVWGSIVFLFKQKYIRNIVASLLIFIAVLTHFANAQKAAQITQATRDFWWQVSWRIPQLERNTTLVANYAVGATEEDYFVWGPASLIYYPESTRAEYVQPGVFAALLNQDTVDKILLNEGQEFDNRRTIRTYKNYRRLLVLTQPTVDSCVHVIDGEQPEYATGENASIQIIGPYSSLELILTNEPAHTPPPVVFGPEPEHDWCYYYQAASLARQKGDWTEVVRFGDQAQELGLAPVDLVEWMPFLHAYAYQGDVRHLKELAPKVVSDSYMARQVCHSLRDLQNLTQPVVDVIDLQYCVE
jgi:hypothetical protein